MATGLLALVFASVAFAVGAISGLRSLAVSCAATIAVALFVVEGLAAQVSVLRGLREASPWHWLLHSDPLRHGLTWQAWLLPTLTSLVLIAIGTMLFGRRDLR